MKLTQTLATKPRDTVAFLKPLATQNDPKEIKKSTKLVTQPIELGKIDIPTNLEALSDDTAAESDTDITEEVGKS